MTADVRRFCQSCDICQKVVPKGKVGKVPLGSMPLIDTPFKRVAVDIIGPIEPMSDDKNRYILTLVDYATRYPEAIALPSIETERISEALLEMFSRVGVPEEIVTDRGTQFTSHMMEEVRRILSIRHLPTTPYHAMGNGLVEKFNGTLKAMLKKMCAEQPKVWDRFLPAVLFAYRETPQVSMGFSPFELLYGRTVRGPLSILREIWDREKEEEVQTTYTHVFDLRQKLEDTCRLAREKLGKAKELQKMYFDRKAKDRKFSVGDKVLLLLPTIKNKLLLQWKGPYEVVDVKRPMDYIINVEGKHKLFHANMLKLYIDRQETSAGMEVSVAATTTVIEEEEEDRDSQFVLPVMTRKQTWKDVHINGDLNDNQKQEVREVLQQYEDVLSDVPGRTDLVQHKINLVQEQIIKVKPYKIPFSLRAEVNAELEEMRKLNIIEPSVSPFSIPMVIVKKSDNTHRVCLDFRKLNNLTEFDSEPMSDPENIFAHLRGSNYYTKIDLCKGYWQVPLDEKSRQYTAFQTDKGLFQFVVLPFGLVNAPATFNRMMRLFLSDMPGVHHFLDDILLCTRTWNEHILLLRKVLGKLRDAGLTAKPSKCEVGMTTMEYLGHSLGEDRLWPLEDKVEKVLAAPRPTTKKTLRSFLGLSGYYRKFMPHYSTIAAPLTDLVKKQKPNLLQWDNSHERAFRSLQRSLSSKPVLLLPKLDDQFILRTDASKVGLGAVLLQEQDGEKQPIAYASRKLLPREQRYSTIEKECLGIVWGITKFSVYLYGKPFILETDHKPLAYLHSSKELNSRLMRWALMLQSYMFHVKVLKGSENVGADFLSRI